MEETYYKYLRLPELPLLDKYAFISRDWGSIGYSIITEPAQILSKEFLTKLNSVGLTPGFIVVFTNASDGIRDQRYIHSDIITKQDPRLVKDLTDLEWQSAEFGINFEVCGNTNKFYWYDTKLLQAKARPVLNSSTPLLHAWLSGIHYTNLAEVSESCTLDIDSRPVLVRTDLPHQTTFNVPQGYSHRLGISVRFYEPWTWAEALEKFNKLII